MYALIKSYQIIYRCDDGEGVYSEDGGRWLIHPLPISYGARNQIISIWI